MQQLEKLRPDHIRRLNPTPYKVCLRFNLSFPFCFLQFPFFFLQNLYFEQVSVSAKLYEFIHSLWLNEAPVGELQQISTEVGKNREAYSLKHSKIAIHQRKVELCCKKIKKIVSSWAQPYRIFAPQFLLVQTSYQYRDRPTYLTIHP